MSTKAVLLMSLQEHYNVLRMDSHHHSFWKGFVHCLCKSCTKITLCKICLGTTKEICGPHTLGAFSTKTVVCPSRGNWIGLCQFLSGGPHRFNVQANLRVEVQIY